jgi:hypothetical protein
VFVCVHVSVCACVSMCLQCAFFSRIIVAVSWPLEKAHTVKDVMLPRVAKEEVKQRGVCVYVCVHVCVCVRACVSAMYEFCAFP